MKNRIKSVQWNRDGSYQNVTFDKGAVVIRKPGSPATWFALDGTEYLPSVRDVFERSFTAYLEAQRKPYHKTKKA